MSGSGNLVVVYGDGEGGGIPERIGSARGIPKIPRGRGGQDSSPLQVCLQASELWQQMLLLALHCDFRALK